MELASLRRDMAAIDGGRWVDKTELPELLDIRIKARGLGGADTREAVAKMERDGSSRHNAVKTVIDTMCFLDIEGLTSNGKPLTAEDIRGQLADPAMEPLAQLIANAVGIVDLTREANAEALAKN